MDHNRIGLFAWRCPDSLILRWLSVSSWEIGFDRSGTWRNAWFARGPETPGCGADRGLQQISLVRIRACNLLFNSQNMRPRDSIAVLRGCNSQRPRGLRPASCYFVASVASRGASRRPIFQKVRASRPTHRLPATRLES
jgi:hypothetical protein